MLIICDFIKVLYQHCVMLYHQVVMGCLMPTVLDQHPWQKICFTKFFIIKKILFRSSLSHRRSYRPPSCCRQNHGGQEGRADQIDLDHTSILRRNYGGQAIIILHRNYRRAQAVLPEFSNSVFHKEFDN
jgi:hypothetical protein